MFLFFSYNYKDGTIETAKCSRKKPKYNFRGTERPFKLKKEKRPWKRDNIIKDVKNHFKLKKEIEPIRDIRNLFRSKKENKIIKNKTTKNIWNLFEKEKEDYYKPKRVDNFWSRNYIAYESDGDRNETLSTEEYLNKIRRYLRNIINDLKTSDTWKIQLATAVNFVSSKDTEEEHAMHSKRDQIKIMTKDYFFLDIKLG